MLEPELVGEITKGCTTTDSPHCLEVLCTDPYYRTCTVRSTYYYNCTDCIGTCVLSLTCKLMHTSKLTSTRYKTQLYTLLVPGTKEVFPGRGEETPFIPQSHAALQLAAPYPPPHKRTQRRALTELQAEDRRVLPAVLVAFLTPQRPG